VSESEFPIMFGDYRVREQTEKLRRDGGRVIIVALPWEMISPHERQAQRNHGGQTLKRLAERGGLSAAEAVAVLEDRDFRSMTFRDANDRLARLLDAYLSLGDCP
jgi:hypothetical protein